MPSRPLRGSIRVPSEARREAGCRAELSGMRMDRVVPPWAVGVLLESQSLGLNTAPCFYVAREDHMRAEYALARVRWCYQSCY